MKQEGLVERIPHNWCTRLEEGPSQLGLQKEIRKVIFSCPRCGEERLPPQFDTRSSCSSCKLWFIRLGAYLYCAEKDEYLNEWNLDLYYPSEEDN